MQVLAQKTDCMTVRCINRELKSLAWYIIRKYEYRQLITYDEAVTKSKDMSRFNNNNIT